MLNDMLSDETLLENAINRFGLLLVQGKISVDDCPAYESNTSRYLSKFKELAAPLDAEVIQDPDFIYLIPKSYKSPIHCSRAELRSRYFKKSSETISCVYLSELLMLILIGMFYEGGTLGEPNAFVEMTDWQNEANNFFSYVRTHREEYEEAEVQDSINWISLLEQWDSMNETIDDADAKLERRTKRWYIQQTFAILKDNDFATINSDNEIMLTIKAKRVIHFYLTDEGLHRHILDRVTNLKDGTEAIAKED